MGIGRENGFSVVEGFGSPAADVGHFPSATPRSDDFRRRSERAGKRRKKKRKEKKNKIICARRKMKSEGGANKIFQVRTNEIKIKKTSATCPAEKHDRLSQGKQKW